MAKDPATAVADVILAHPTIAATDPAYVFTTEAEAAANAPTVVVADVVLAIIRSTDQPLHLLLLAIIRSTASLLAIQSIFLLLMHAQTSQLYSSINQSIPTSTGDVEGHGWRHAGGGRRLRYHGRGCPVAACWHGGNEEK